MRWGEGTEPVRMQRVALVAPRESLRDLLVLVADAGVAELDTVPRPDGGGAGDAARRLQRLGPEGRPSPRLSRHRPDLAALERAGRADLLAGEVELEDRAAGALVRGDVAGVAGWVPAADVPGLESRLSEIGAAVVPLPRPPATDPPTLLRPGGRMHRSFAPLVQTYATVPYADVDPTLLAGVAYVAMFGMMFGDAGHGLLLLLGALLLRAGRVPFLAKLRSVWPFVAGAGVAATLFGLLYGEFFGPTGVVPVLWLAPLDEPVPLLVAALSAGTVLLAAAYAVGSVNRWREGGWRLALYAPSGLAGATLFLGFGLMALGFAVDEPWLLAGGAVLGAGGVLLAFAGLLAVSGGGAAGVTQAVVEVFDLLVRLGANLVSFARLAAFGLMHAALGFVVWDGTTALAGRGGAAIAVAVVVFVVGNALAFTLEALVAGIQALRLEYYELFSRVFQDEGRPFRPWQVPLATPAPPGAELTEAVP